jgi:hypothetical protein
MKLTGETAAPSQRDEAPPPREEESMSTPSRLAAKTTNRSASALPAIWTFIKALISFSIFYVFTTFLKGILNNWLAPDPDATLHVQLIILAAFIGWYLIHVIFLEDYNYLTYVIVGICFGGFAWVTNFQIFYLLIILALIFAALRYEQTQKEDRLKTEKAKKRHARRPQPVH